MRFHLRNRDGMAMATAVLAIVLIGALIAGTFFATTQEYRATRNALGSQRALTAAEYGPNMLIRDWNLAWNQTMKTGNSFRRIYVPASGVVDTVVLTRLRHNMFYASSTGRVGTLRDAESRRRTGTLIRLNVPTMPFPGAFTGNSSSQVSGNFKASGNDSIPAGWTDCPPPGDQMPAIASDAAANVPTPMGSCSSLGCLTGTPKIAVTPDAGDSAKVFDGWDDLTSRANLVIAATSLTGGNGIGPKYNANGTCNTTLWNSWGDPLRSTPAGACEGYFPIIHVTSLVKGALGSTAIVNTGSGQGILLVDGNLSMQGNFTWVGPIIVRGNVSLSGNGNKSVGGITAFNQGCITSPCNALSGTSDVTYSSCTIDKILSQKVYPVPAKHHAWTDLF
jgi:hypothetical protein